MPADQKQAADRRYPRRRRLTPSREKRGNDAGDPGRAKLCRKKGAVPAVAENECKGGRGDDQRGRDSVENL